MKIILFIIMMILFIFYFKWMDKRDIKIVKKELNERNKQEV